ncbi:MAG: glycoside hydrolase [Lachnospiraceae bacterium]|nr:glycoside hydrolase [Lachnospiraceae bacterium]
MITKLFMTSGVPLKKTVSDIEMTDEALEPRALENQVVNLYPDFTYQTITGFGGAMTEASGYALSQLEPEKQAEMIGAYFGPKGNGYSVIRTHIDSSDFSCSMYQAVADVKADPEFATFNIDRDRKYIIPAIKKAMEAAGYPITVLLSPWSPPAEWKTESEMLKGFREMADLKKVMATEQQDAEIREENPMVRHIMETAKNAPTDGSGTRVCGGHLKPEYYASWAKYIAMYVKAYLDEGIPVKFLTVQNEAQAATPWDSCQWTPEEEHVFLRDYLYPAMEKEGLTDRVGLYFWDHNKENLVNRTKVMMDEKTEKMVEGTAFHWYSGDHFEAVALVHERWPKLRLMLTEECCEFTDDPAEELVHGQRYAHDMIGNLNAGMDTWFDWNLYLDETGGPNHVGNFCSAPVMLDGEGGFETKASYDYIGHFSRHIAPGAKRIGWTKYTDAFDMTAFKNPSGKIIAVFLNRQKEALPINIRLEGNVAKFTLPAESIATAVIREE